MVNVSIFQCSSSCQQYWQCQGNGKIKIKFLQTYFIKISIKGTQIGLWGQCGGLYYKGPTICVSNMTCCIQNSVNSQCFPSCPAGWLSTTTNTSLTSSSPNNTNSTIMINDYSFNSTSTIGN